MIKHILFYTIAMLIVIFIAPIEAGAQINEDRPGGGMVITVDRPSSASSSSNGRGDREGGHKVEKGNDGNPNSTPQETALQRHERQVREMVERKMQWRTAAQIAHGLLIGEKAQREIFAKDAEHEIVERDRIQREKDLEADRVQKEERRKQQLERLNNIRGGRD